MCRIFGGHTSSSLLWSADGDDFVVVIPLSDDWSAQLQAEFQQAQPMGSRLEIASLRYHLQPSGGICRINRNGCKATVRNEDLVKATPIILRDGDKTFEVPREHSSLMHAVITGAPFPKQLLISRAEFNSPITVPWTPRSFARSSITPAAKTSPRLEEAAVILPGPCWLSAPNG